MESQVLEGLRQENHQFKASIGNLLRHSPFRHLKIKIKSRLRGVANSMVGFLPNMNETLGLILNTIKK